MSFLNLNAKRIIVFGLANKKSIACAIAKVLIDEGAEVIHVVRSEARREAALKLFPKAKVYCCDVEDEANIIRVRDEIASEIGGPIHGLVHSIAFANYSAGIQPFHRFRCDLDREYDFTRLCMAHALALRRMSTRSGLRKFAPSAAK